MKAVTFDMHVARLALSKVLGAFSPHGYVSGLGAVRFESVPDAKLLGKEWLLVEPRFAGVCGSDVTQVFLEAAPDNPLSAVVSAPHVMGHEVVGTVLEAGPSVRRFKKGDRVAVSPWLSCAPRGLPACEACDAGNFPLCSHFFDGPLAKGMHLGNCRDVGGGFAEAMSLHESMLFPIPDSVDLDAAVLADPVAVALHAVLRAPPEPGQTVLVVGCGSLGLPTIHLLSVLFPGVTILATDPKASVRPLAERLGAHHYFTSSGGELIAQIGERIQSPLRRPFFGEPWLQGGVDRVYDTVGAPGTLQVAVRVAKPRGSIVMVGVARPKRFEWTPLYFKELALLGSNAYGVETLPATAGPEAGKRVHAILFYLDLLAHGRLKLGELVTHRYPLARYGDAFVAAYDKRSSGATKVIFDPQLSVPQVVPGARA